MRLAETSFMINGFFATTTSSSIWIGSGVIATFKKVLLSIRTVTPRIKRGLYPTMVTRSV